MTTLLVNGVNVRMEVVTGASLSILSESTYRKLWTGEQAPPLQHTDVQLRTYTGESIVVLRAIDVEV